MRTKLSLDWTENMAFKTELNGHEIMIDADEKSGGNNLGPRPKPLMLLALAGCTGVDVISMLKKMRVDVDDFRVTTDANSTEEPPKHYDEIVVQYEFWGKELKNQGQKLRRLSGFLKKNIVVYHISTSKSLTCAQK